MMIGWGSESCLIWWLASILIQKKKQNITISLSSVFFHLKNIACLHPALIIHAFITSTSILNGASSKILHKLPPELACPLTHTFDHITPVLQNLLAPHNSENPLQNPPHPLERLSRPGPVLPLWPTPQPHLHHLLCSSEANLLSPPSKTKYPAWGDRSFSSGNHHQETLKIAEMRCKFKVLLLLLFLLLLLLLFLTFEKCKTSHLLWVKEVTCTTREYSIQRKGIKVFPL